VISDGAERKNLQKIAKPNIEFLGRQSDEAVTEYMENCRGFVFPGDDDFGITPVEVMSCGKPVLAYGMGGALETVIPGKTGELFEEQNLKSMEKAFKRLLTNEKQYKISMIRKHAEGFSTQRFLREMQSVIKNVLNTNEI